MVHFLGPPGTGKSHLPTALGVAAVKAGKSVYRATLAELIGALVMDPPGQVAEAHWNEEAEAILGGLIMFCVYHEGRDRRSLATVREYLTLPRIG